MNEKKIKDLVVLALLIALVFQGCGKDSKATDNRNDKNFDNNFKSITEEKLSPSAESQDTGKATPGSIRMTKDFFLKKVWDYNNSPREWKFLGEKPVIIDFYADWCGPCRIASPILEKIAEEYAGKIDVYKIDTEKERELAAVFGIQSIPAFLYIPKNGRPVMMAGIARTQEDTRKMFIDNISKYLQVQANQ